MIDFFSSWAEQIIIAVIVSSIIEMILPENKNKKYIKMVIGIYILFTIISPIIDKKDMLRLSDLNFDSYASYENIEPIKTENVNQESMDERLEELYIEELENNIKTKVQQEGYIVDSCKVDAVLYGKDENKGINKIKLVLSEKINISDDNKNKNNKSNINSINKIEIKIGMDNIISKDNQNEETKITKQDIQELKKIISSYYEMDINKITISIK